MQNPSGSSLRVVTIVLVILVAGAVVLMFTRRAPNPVLSSAPSTTQSAATGPVAATAPATPVAPRTLLDAVRADHPDFPTTQLLDEPLELRDAAPLIISDPVYLCPRLDLWITRADAQPTAAVLLQAYDDRDHILNEKVAFAHWQSNESGDWLPYVVVPSNGGFELIIPPATPAVRRRHNEVVQLPNLKRLPLARRDYDWSRALSWMDRIVVPTATGFSVLRIEKDRISDLYQDLVPPTQKLQSKIQSPQVLLDTRGLLAWIPATDSTAGSRGAFRFVDDKWVPLSPDQGWPEKILHLVPLLDGSVLQIIPATKDKVELRLAILDPPQISADRIGTLVDGLSDEKESTRNAAFDELTRYGPAVWPILEKLLADQPPESQIRLRQILKNKIEPNLGGFSLVNNQLRVVDRFAGGGVLFYADGGVSIPAENGKPEIIPAAWLSALPGQAIALLSPRLTRDFRLDSVRLYASNSEWVASDPANGPRRFNGVSLTNVLAKSQRHFSEFIGKDHAGRWLFRDPSQPGTGNRESGTLILDPTIPDPTPKLPVWNYPVANGTVGWDQNNWPVIKAGGAFAIEDAAFRVITPKDHMYTRVEDVPTQPATKPATSPATTQTSLGAPLLTTPEGTYYDGRSTLTLVSDQGKIITWPLPPAATGSLAPWLIRSDAGLLFLYNQPGRMLRIRLNSHSVENQKSKIKNDEPPFVLEASFTHKIPNTDKPARIWLDPAGRIVFAYGNSLSILFPTGRIPRATINIIPVNELDEVDQ